MARLSEDAALVSAVEAAAAICARSLLEHGRLFFFGNGGSAADAIHFAAEFTGRFRLQRAPLAAAALGTSISSLTAIANDFGYSETFARELRALASPGDVAFAISTSGSSTNVVGALRAAREMQLHTIALMGQRRATLADFADVALHVPAADTARIQEAHGVLGHLICGLVEAQLATSSLSRS